MRVFVVMEIRAEDGDKNSPTWRRFFEAFPDVNYIEWSGTADGCTDLVVYYKDSEEPFPITSLLAASCIRIELEKIIEWA